MKEYLTKNSNGDYQLVNHRFSDNDIEIPEGAMFATGKNNPVFRKDYFYYCDDEGVAPCWKKTDVNLHLVKNNVFSGLELSWVRSAGTLIEYLNPTDWSLHVVDVDNAAEGEDWIKVPDGADAYIHVITGTGKKYFYKFGENPKNYKDGEWSEIWNKYNSANEFIKDGDIVLWQRHTQPEELPFVDDEPKGQKHDSAKPRMSLLPKGVLSSVVSVLEFGAKKYQEDNWKQVSNAKTRYYDAMQRHIGAWWDGEKNDPETGEHHLAHAICCAMFLIWFDKEQSQ